MISCHIKKVYRTAKSIYKHQYFSLSLNLARLLRFSVGSLSIIDLVRLAQGRLCVSVCSVELKCCIHRSKLVGHGSPLPCYLFISLQAVVRKSHHSHVLCDWGGVLCCGLENSCPAPFLRCSDKANRVLKLLYGMQ